MTLLSSLLSDNMGWVNIIDVSESRDVTNSDNNKCLNCVNIENIDLTLKKDVRRGTCVRVIQSSSGIIHFNTESGAPPLNNLLDYDSTAGEDSEVVLTCLNNPDGVSAVWLASGAMAP